MEDYLPLHENMTKIIMVRHGQSVANLEDRFAGYSNFDLTELGKEQARLAAKYLADKGLRPDVIYSSDLLRAHNTAVPFSKEFDLPINDTEELREIFAGKWEGMKFDDINEQYAADWSVWRNDFSNCRCTEGESPRELYRRIVRAVKELARKNLGKTILITTHATPVRSVDCYSRGWGEERIGDVKFVRNSSISIFEYDDTDESIKPISVGLVDHLDESMVTALPKSV